MPRHTISWRHFYVTYRNRALHSDIVFVAQNEVGQEETYQKSCLPKIVSIFIKVDITIDIIRFRNRREVVVYKTMTAS